MRGSAFRYHSALLFLALFTLSFTTIASASGPVTGTYKVVIIQTTYSDGPAAVSTPANLNLAAGEIHDYFSKLSFGALDVQVTIGRASLTQPMSHYWSSCPSSDDAGKMCVDEGALTGDAAEAAGAGGVNFANVKATVVLSPCGVNDPYNNFTSGGDQDLNSTHAHAHVHRVFDTDCPDDPRYPLTEFPHLGPSGVNWHGWAHEIGHSIQLEGQDMFSHPGGYSSGYDLMDSCYPCGETVYSLSSSPVVSNDTKTSFPGWLPSSKTLIIPRPTTGTAGGTYVLEPVNKPDPGATVAPRGIKLPLEGDRSIFVEARTAVGSDARSYGLFDEGIHMYIAEEGRTVSGWPTPLTMLNACETTVSGGCVQSDADPRYSSCLGAPHAHVADSHPYCWPFVLWHPGDTFNDPINAIMMHVNGRVGDGYGVTVTRNVPPGHPDPFLYPWLTAPMNTYETVDIWVDSSCNGYEDTVGAAGLRYGRRSDTTVVGNGDDPCANHENRIYARIRNGGSVPANSVTVHFQVTDPLGVGVSGSWSDVGTTTIPTIPAGGFRDVFVAWTPHVTLTPAEISSGHFNFHSCVQITITPIGSEIVTSNNSAQENFDHFEAVRDPVTHNYAVADRRFFVANNYSMAHDNFATMAGAAGHDSDFYRPIELRIKSTMPPDWHYDVNGGVYDFTLAPHEVKQVPVKVQVPPGTPTARTFNLRVTAFAQHHYINRAVAPDSPNRWHFGWMQVAGVVEGVQTVDPSKITITAEWKCPDTTRALTHVPPAQIVVKGKLEPAHNNVIVAIDYTPPSGPVQTHLVHTNAAGEFQDTLNNPAAGEWHIRAFWQGDMDHSGAVSDEQKVSPRDCNKKQEQQPTQPTRPTQLPPGSTVLLPPDSFPGGVLTGVVIGPDDKPVPNTPVQIAGGVPTELTGVVIGEEPTPERPKPPERAPCTPDPATGQLPAGCPPPTQTACGPNTPAGTPGCPGGKQPTLPPINVPQDCASLLQKARGILDQAAPGTDHILIGLDQPSVPVGTAGQFGKPDEANAAAPGGYSGGQDATGNTYLNQNGGGITTDANGRFALCVRPDSKKVDVSLGDGSVRGSVPASGQPPSGTCDKPPQFFQPADRIDFCKTVKKPTLEQGGQTWLLPAVQAISPNGDRVLTTVRTPRDLQPGEATLSFVDQGGEKRSFTGGVFRIISASLDRNKLRSNEGADFDYEIAFSPQWGGKQLCINVGTSGPIVLVQPPPAQLDVNGDGHASVKGKIRATQVAPGSATPFSIKLHISDCREAAQSDTQMDQMQDRSAGGTPPAAATNLQPAPVVPNPWAQPSPDMSGGSLPQRDAATLAQTAVNAQPRSGKPGGSVSKKPPTALSPCVLGRAPVISGLTNDDDFDSPVKLLTPYPGFYTIHGCNFSSPPGKAYLIFPPPGGQVGFDTSVALDLPQAASSWHDDRIGVRLPPVVGRLDQDEIRVQVVTDGGQKAELPHLSFFAMREKRLLTWIPPTHVHLAQAQYKGQSYPAVFQPSGDSHHTSSEVMKGIDPAFKVSRTSSNIGGTWSLSGDLFELSGMQPGFVVLSVQPAYPAYPFQPGIYCDQVVGAWRMLWPKAGELEGDAASCYKQRSGVGSIESAYSFDVTVQGPKGVAPWPPNAH